MLVNAANLIDPISNLNPMRNLYGEIFHPSKIFPIAWIVIETTGFRQQKK